jgi:anti-sigma factor RsiW
LSAYLDGELDEAGYQRAYQHLSVCAHCQAELEEINRVRTIMRTAPPVEPPFGFVERLVREQRRRRWVPMAAAVVGLAAAWVLVVAIGGGAVGVESPVGDIAAAQSELTGGVGEVERFDADAIEFAVAERDDIPAAFRGPEEAGDADFVAGFEALNRDGWLMAYDLDGEPVVVYAQQGDVESLPPGGERFEIDGDPAWRGAVDGRNAVVVQRGGMLYTIIGEADVEALIAMAEDLPEGQNAEAPSLGERLADGADDFVSGFALGL